MFKISTFSNLPKKLKRCSKDVNTRDRLPSPHLAWIAVLHFRRDKVWISYCSRFPSHRKSPAPILPEAVLHKIRCLVIKANTRKTRACLLSYDKMEWYGMSKRKSMGCQNGIVWNVKIESYGMSKRNRMECQDGSYGMSKRNSMECQNGMEWYVPLVVSLA